LSYGPSLLVHRWGVLPSPSARFIPNLAPRVKPRPGWARLGSIPDNIQLAGRGRTLRGGGTGVGRVTFQVPPGGLTGGCVRQRERLPRSTRLTRQADFQHVLRQGCSVADRNLVVYLAPNELPWSRLGLRVGKRVGNAVCRNAFRRRLREAFRHNLSDLPAGFDIVCIVRVGARTYSRELHRSLCTLVSRAARRGDHSR